MSQWVVDVIINVLPWVYTAVLCLLISAVLVQYSILAAERFNVLARPSARGSHSRPTPRLGGLGAALAFYIVLLLMYRWWLELRPSPWMAALIVGSGYALAGGLLDDVLELSPRWKFAFQFAAAGTVLVFGFMPDSVRISSNVTLVLAPALSAILTFVFIVFMMNAYNFMDGMDGQASLFGIIASLAIAYPLVYHSNGDNQTEGYILLTLAGALGGLLAYNYPGRPQSRKTFMGDSGSQFFGFMLAMFALRTEQGQIEPLSLPACLIILSPFIWDVCYTLVRRLLRGENILQAHRSHLYQRLLIAGWSHRRVLALNAVFWILCAALGQMYSAQSALGQMDSVQSASHSTNRQMVIAGATVSLLVLYTLLVMLVEERQRVRITKNPTEAI